MTRTQSIWLKGGVADYSDLMQNSSKDRYSSFLRISVFEVCHTKDGGAAIVLELIQTPIMLWDFSGIGHGFAGLVFLALLDRGSFFPVAAEENKLLVVVVILVLVLV